MIDLIIGTCRVTLRASWVSSLKEKRMIVKSIIERTKNKFNVSIAEVEEQDNHKIIVLGFACVSNETAHANSMIDHVINFIESHTEALLEDTEIEIL